MIENLRNWAGNYTYGAARLHSPETVEQVQELVVRCGRLKALGTRHSFNGIADIGEDLISLEHFNHIVELNRERRSVTVEARVTGMEIWRRLYRLSNSLLPAVSWSLYPVKTTASSFRGRSLGLVDLG
jgi:xylitol oxidase